MTGCATAVHAEPVKPVGSRDDVGLRCAAVQFSCSGVLHFDGDSHSVGPVWSRRTCLCLK